MPASDSPMVERTVSWLSSFRGPWRSRDLALLVLLCPLLLGLGAVLSERLRLQGFVMPGIEVDGQAVEGLSQEVLRHRLLEASERIASQSLLVRVGQQQFRIVGDELGAALDVDAAVTAVMSAGRSGSPLSQVRWRIQRWSGPWPMQTKLLLDPRLVEERLTNLEARALSTPQEAALQHDGKRLLRTEPRPGQIIVRESSIEALRLALAEGRVEPLVLELRDVAPRSTGEQLDAVEAQAQRLLAGPLTLTVVAPDGTGPSNSMAQPPPGANGAEQPMNEVRILPAALAKTLVTRVSEGRLQLSLDEKQLDVVLEPIRRRYEQPATDARFDVNSSGKISISPSRVQTRLYTDHAQRSLLAAAEHPERRGQLEIVEAEPPRITTELAASLNINKLVGQFTTYHPCCRPRVRNIHRMADLIGGTVVLPGETFSINEKVGPRTAAAGFVPAPTIVHGEIDDTAGGGVSQFATTIFNAVLDAGYEIIERQPHSYYFSRYPVGHEATLSYPKPDFIFRNDTKSGVLIVTEYGATYIRVKIYGDNEGRKVEREVSERFDFTDPPLVYTADDTLLPDEAVVKVAGERGFSVNVARILTRADGTRHTESRKVVYNPRERVVAVHSCRIPEGEPGYTGDECPEPELLDAGVSPLEP